MSGLHYVCQLAELPAGERKIVTVEGVSIGVFNVHGTYHALRNVCPHKLAPLCLGPITGHAQGSPGKGEMDREGEIVRCPWHGWEFDIKTGRSIFNPHRVRVKCYEVSVAESSLEKSETETDPQVDTYPVHVEAQGIYVRV